MASSNASTIKEYLAELPEDRREALTAIRKVIKANLPKGYKEGMQYGLIGYYIPLSRYPKTYNGKPLGVIALGAQKRHMAIYLMSVYGNPDLESWFRGAFAKAGKRLNMGKSCVRFNKLSDLPLDVIGETVARVSVNDFIASYETAQAGTAAGKKKAAKKAAAKQAPVGRRKKKARNTPSKKVATNVVGERPTEEMLAKKAAKEAAAKSKKAASKSKAAKKKATKKAFASRASKKDVKKKGATKKTAKKTAKKAAKRTAKRTAKTGAKPTVKKARTASPRKATSNPTKKKVAKRR